MRLHFVPAIQLISPLIDNMIHVNYLHVEVILINISRDLIRLICTSFFDPVVSTAKIITSH